uniref:INO80 complex subunit E N-terminal domain-containing protein n=1 Tax=Wuchereria bancrofti TaxID=6293 RepID=A0A1I8E9P3_WUCBA
MVIGSKLGRLSLGNPTKTGNTGVMLESEQQQQLTDGRSLGGCQQTNAVTAQQQQLTFLVTTQQPLPSVGHVIGQPQSVQNQSCYISTGQVTSALNCVSSPVPSRTTSTPHTHSSAIPSPSSLSVQSTNGGQCSVQLRGTASCPPQSLSNPSALSSTRVNAPSPVQTSSNAIGTVPHFQRQHSVSFTTGASSHAEHLRCTTNTNFDGEYDNVHRQQPIICDENECYQEELRNLQRKLLKLSRDKNFLLDRLLLYEKLSDSSDESDSSVKTVEEKVPPKKKSRPPASRRRSTNARAKGANNTSCIDSDATKISVMEQQQQVQKQSLEQPSEQHRLPLQPTEATSCIGVPVCSSSETGTGEQRAAVSVPICCSSERNIKREETVIGPPATENAFFEENRSVQFSSSTFTSSR